MKKFKKIKPVRKSEDLFLNASHEEKEKFVPSHSKRTVVRSRLQQVTESTNELTYNYIEEFPKAKRPQVA
jgi:hypothetical protein